MAFPCTLNIDHERVFILGRVFQVDRKIKLVANVTQAYIFDFRRRDWLQLDGFPCANDYNLEAKHSCAMLRPQVIISVVNDCTAVWYLSSSHWSSFTTPLTSGVIFNADEEEKTVFYIGSVGNGSGSKLYMVHYSIFFSMLLN